jgi:hypothetical protein
MIIIPFFIEFRMCHRHPLFPFSFLLNACDRQASLIRVPVALLLRAIARFFTTRLVR